MLKYLDQSVQDEMLLIDLVSDGVFTFEQLENTVSLDDVLRVSAKRSYDNAVEREVMNDT